MKKAERKEAIKLLLAYIKWGREKPRTKKQENAWKQKHNWLLGCEFGELR